MSKLAMQLRGLTAAALLMGHLFAVAQESSSIRPDFQAPAGITLLRNQQVAQAKQTPQQLQVTARQAFALKQKMGDRLLFVDVRTRAEAIYVGFPSNADVLIPYMEHPEMMDEWDEDRQTYGWGANNGFTQELKIRLAEKGLNAQSPIMLICRSGERSAFAAKLLAQLGYNNVITVVDGFEGDEVEKGAKAGQRLINGWKNAGLPWTYNLEKKRMYFPR